VISFLVDQNFNEHVVDGLTRREANLIFTHVRNVGLATARDPLILEWAATRGLVLLTHDGKTIPAFAHARVAAGQPMRAFFWLMTDCRSGRRLKRSSPLLIA
jgi:predicted nuclease of predicted toxin-antitoxin system